MLLQLDGELCSRVLRQDVGLLLPREDRPKLDFASLNLSRQVVVSCNDVPGAVVVGGALAVDDGCLVVLLRRIVSSF